jgi:cytochrome c556
MNPFLANQRRNAFASMGCSLVLGMAAIAAVVPWGEGCGQAPAARSATEAQSYRAAVTALVAIRDTIRDAFAANDPDKAHDPLHEVGHLLEELPAIAEKNTSPVDSAAVKAAAETLFELYSQVDEKMHGGEGADYAAVAAKIDAGVERLQALVP